MSDQGFKALEYALLSLAGGALVVAVVLFPVGMAFLATLAGILWAAFYMVLRWKG